MQRKLIKQGGGGYTIYLPKKWVSENGFDKGEELHVEEVGKNLIISPSALVKKTETTIKLENLTESSIRTLITNTYRAGYDKITVRFEHEAQFKILQKTVKTKLIGFDVIKKEANYCVVENITEPSYDQFDNLLRKMFMNIEELFEITAGKLGIKEVNEADDFEEVEERILKYDNFCRRAITKRKLIDQKSEFFWTFLAIVIHGNRELYHLNKLIVKKVKVSSKTVYLFEKAHEIFVIIEKAYFDKNISLLAKIHEMEKDVVYNKGYGVLKDKNSNDSVFAFHLMSCARHFYLANSPLAGLIV
jgi:phosphate uptake regulator